MKNEQKTILKNKLCFKVAWEIHEKSIKIQWKIQENRPREAPLEGLGRVLGPKMARGGVLWPTWPQLGPNLGPKMEPKSNKNQKKGIENQSNVQCLLESILLHLGPILGPNLGPKIRQNR